MEKAEFWTRLLMIKGLGAHSLCQLQKQFSLQNMNTSDPAECLSLLSLTASQQAEFFRPNSRYLSTTLRWLEESGNQMILFTDEHYPPLLRQIGYPPAAIFVRGRVATLSAPQLAIVGSRHPTTYGERWGGYFAHLLSSSGLTITSGLARGIDGIAHRGALEAEGTTVAVLGSGLGKVYPQSHIQLAEEIVNSGGALVSEHCPGEPPLAVHFPRRNRIISGLSQAVLVVEATQRSGSLITARYALEQGRDIFALPGSLDCENMSGCHWLIQQGAYLVSHPKDILEQLNLFLCVVPETPWQAQKEHQPHSNSSQELPFAQLLANVGDEVSPIDVIAVKSGFSVPEVVTQLLELELAGWIVAVPGGYVRKRRAGHV